MVGKRHRMPYLHWSFSAKKRPIMVRKRHRMPYLYRSFSTEEPCNEWLVCGKRPATYGSL